MARVLVTEKIADGGLDALRAAGHDVDVQTGLDPEQLVAAIGGAHALIIRSSTTVTAEVLEAGTDLVVVGRAGIGLDNVDVETATRRGVMVVNAPQSNILSTAEHTMAMLLSVARHIPQAHGALVEGRWERSEWVGVEMADKTLGIVGLGRIGKLVAQRASAFGMKIIAHDPFVAAERARQLNIELVDLETLAATADFVTLHVVKTPDTIGMIGEDFFARAKPGIRIVNVSRGGVIDEDALAAALADGRCGGAALDVFTSEPPTGSPLFARTGFVGTPHLGASTREAQDKAGDTIAEQVRLALAGEFVPFAVNIAAAEASETVRPFLGVAEQLGGIFAGLSEGLPPVIDIEYQGELAGYDIRILTLSVLKGAFAGSTEEPVSYVNAPQVAAERGIEVRDTTTVTSRDWVNLVTVAGGGHSVSGTLVGLRSEPRLVLVDGHTVDVPPSPHMVIVRNDDRPGVIGRVGSVLGDAGVNIADMDVGRSAEGASALMVISTSQAVSSGVVDAVLASDGVSSVAVVDRT
ncbi:phosphoglycerate dehydrogenase [Iamia sp.]|uniref:phosphoglycerate dehydrogenase n=1 Tax=Iamia sp. TaxID=2722710 RepID=UPI002CBB4E94|nr:phosphoglycerate dehydrogenase [Iamia sp.]HXH57272.1 phosphoglycerate dehydrogenase [Iamia sp.]